MAWGQKEWIQEDLHNPKLVRLLLTVRRNYDSKGRTERSKEMSDRKRLQGRKEKQEREVMVLDDRAYVSLRMVVFSKGVLSYRLVQGVCCWFLAKSDVKNNEKDARTHFY